MSVAMPDSKKYTTLSITKGVKADLTALKGGGDTYSSLLRRLIDEREMSDDDIKQRLDFIQNRQLEQVRLLVRIADEMGLEKEQIPENMAEYESWGSNSPWAAPVSDEKVTDVYSDEKEARMQAREEVLDLDEVRNSDGPLHGGRISPEQEERIEERTAAILEEGDTRGDPPWEADNEGENE